MASLILEFASLNGSKTTSFKLDIPVQENILDDYQLWDESKPFSCSKHESEKDNSCSDCLFGSWGYNYDMNNMVKNRYYKYIFENCNGEYLNMAYAIMHVENLQTQNENANIMSWRIEND